MNKMQVFNLIVILALLSVSVVMFSCRPQASVVQVVPEGFVGVPWGASRDQVIKIMRERGYRSLGTGGIGGSGAVVLNFRGEFTTVPCSLSFILIDDSFYEGEAMFYRPDMPQPNKTLQTTFDNIDGMLSEKYGPPRERESSSYKDKEGIDRPSKSTFWYLVDNKSSDIYTVQVMLDYYVTVYYRACSLETRLKNKNY